MRKYISNLALGLILFAAGPATAQSFYPLIDTGLYPGAPTPALPLAIRRMISREHSPRRRQMICSL